MYEDEVSVTVKGLKWGIGLKQDNRQSNYNLGMLSSKQPDYHGLYYKSHIFSYQSIKPVDFKYDSSNGKAHLALGIRTKE